MSQRIPHLDASPPNAAQCTAGCAGPPPFWAGTRLVTSCWPMRSGLAARERGGQRCVLEPLTGAGRHLPAARAHRTVATDERRTVVAGPWIPAARRRARLHWRAQRQVAAPVRFTVAQRRARALASALKCPSVAFFFGPRLPMALHVPSSSHRDLCFLLSESPCRCTTRTASTSAWTTKSSARPRTGHWSRHFGPRPCPFRSSTCSPSSPRRVCPFSQLKASAAHSC